jgi:hypothetical protein
MRGDLEDHRLERLSKMHNTIRALKGLSDEEKKRVTRKLKSAMEPAPTTRLPTTIVEPQIEVEVQADPADIIRLLISSEEREPATHSLEQSVRPIAHIGQPEETETASVSVPVSQASPPTSSPVSTPFEGIETKVNERRRSSRCKHKRPRLLQITLLALLCRPPLPSLNQTLLCRPRGAYKKDLPQILREVPQNRKGTP